MFGTKSFGVISYLNGTFPDDFEVTLDEVKVILAEFGAKLIHFGPLSLSFPNHILDHTIITTLLSRKASLRNISNRYVFVLYCLLKRYRINWANWFKAYIWGSVEESNLTSSFTIWVAYISNSGGPSQ